MVMRWRRKAILAKIEDSYGVDATPTGEANALQATNVQLTPMEAREISRDLDRPYLGGQPQLLVDTHVALSFEIELAGAGTAGTPPAYGPLLRACGFAETVTPESDVQYDPVSASHESVSIYFNQDGTNHKLLGSRGSVALRYRAGEIPKLLFRFLGLFADPAVVALPSVTLSAWQDPLPVSDANTPTFKLGNFSAVMQEAELDIGNDVQFRGLVGEESILIVDRAGSGRIAIEAPALGTMDFFALAKEHTRVALSLVHGTEAGNIVEVSAPKFQIGRPSYENSQNLVHLRIPGVLTPNAGNDELAIIVR